MSHEVLTQGEPPNPDHSRLVATLANGALRNMRATNAHHGARLDALLSAYATELLQHACCWESATKGLRMLATTIDGLRAEGLAAKQAAANAIARAQRPAA